MDRPPSPPNDLAFGLASDDDGDDRSEAEDPPPAAASAEADGGAGRRWAQDVGSRWCPKWKKDKHNSYCAYPECTHVSTKRKPCGVDSQSVLAGGQKPRAVVVPAVRRCLPLGLLRQVSQVG